VWNRTQLRTEKYQDFAAFPSFLREVQTKTAAIYVYACLSSISWHKYLLGSLEFRFSFFACSDANDALVLLLKRPCCRQRNPETFRFPVKSSVFIQYLDLFSLAKLVYTFRI